MCGHTWEPLKPRAPPGHEDITPEISQNVGQKGNTGVPSAQHWWQERTPKDGDGSEGWGGRLQALRPKAESHSGSFPQWADVVRGRQVKPPSQTLLPVHSEGREYELQEGRWETHQQKEEKKKQTVKHCLQTTKRTEKRTETDQCSHPQPLRSRIQGPCCRMIVLKLLGCSPKTDVWLKNQWAKKNLWMCRFLDWGLLAWIVSYKKMPDWQGLGLISRSPS